MKTMFFGLIFLISGCYLRPQVIPYPYYVTQPVREPIYVPMYYPFSRSTEKEIIIEQKQCPPCNTNEYDKRLKKYMEK